MECPRCRRTVPPDARFCSGCGEPIAPLCASCGTENEGDARFCKACGHALAPSAPLTLTDTSPRSYTPAHLAEKILTSRSALEGERKLVTVLFCDIANSTALAERLGPEDMHALLNRFFELGLAEVHRYEGTINQFLGDGFMALFGAPVGHEDHARRAVLAALGIQRSVVEGLADLTPALSVRIGLNTGLVVVGTIGDNLRMDYTAIGDTTNLAARLEQVAEPRTILVSEATRRLVGREAQFESLGPVQVKGKSELVAVYRVLGISTRALPLRGFGERSLSTYVGRDRELAALRDLLDEVEDSRGQVVGLVGEAGVGKSRLLYEFHASLGGRRVTCLEGRCLSYGTAIPYVPVLDILRQNCAIAENDSPQTIREKARSGLEAVGLNSGESLPFLLQLLGVKEEAERLSMLAPESIKRRTFDALLQLSLEASRRQPLILAIEDLHWIDKTSEEFFALLAESLAGAPVLLLTTYRPGCRPPWLERSYATQIALRPLSYRDSLSVVRSVVEGRELAELLAHVILEKAEGNPFFLEELARSVAEQGDEPHQLSVPDTVQGVLQARIDRLADAPKRLLQAASVIGREVSLRLLRAIWDDPGSLDPHLLELKRLEFLYEDTREKERLYVFKHALTQDVAYETLLKSHRQILHEATARALEALYTDRLEECYERLAYHYSRTTNTEKAVEYLDLANQKAIKAHAVQEAMTYFDHAVSLLDTLPATSANTRRRLSLLVNQWIVFWLLFKYPEYYDLLARHEATAVQLGDQGLLGAFYTRLGHCQWVFGQLEQAVETEIKAAQHCELAGNVEDGGVAYCMVQWSHMHLSNYEHVFPWQEKALRALKQRFNLRWYSWALAAASYAYSYLGEWQAALEQGRKELRLAEQYSDKSLICFAHWIIAMAYTSQGDLARAVEHGELAVRIAPTPGDKVWAQSILGWAWCRAGEPTKAVELLDSLVPLYRATRFVPGEVYNGVYLGEAYWRAGELDRATQVLEAVLPVAERAGMRFYTGSAHRLLGEVALQRNPTQAGDQLSAPHFETAIALLRAIRARNELALAYAGYGRLHRRQGRIEEARDYLTRALEIFERLGTLIDPDTVRAELADLPAV